MDTLYAYLQRPASRAAGKPGDPLRFVASTEDVARDGLIIEAAGWDLTNYRKNPVFLWGHDMLGSRPPIGRADVAVEGKRLMADVTFDQGDEFARQIERKYREGFLSAVSVQWDTREFAPPKGPNQAPRITKAELLEISAVPVPSDAGALVAGRSAARRGLLPSRDVVNAGKLGMTPAEYDSLIAALARALRGAIIDRQLSIRLDRDGVPRR